MVKLPPVTRRAKQFAITFSVVASLGTLANLSALDFPGYILLSPDMISDAESGPQRASKVTRCRYQREKRKKWGRKLILEKVQP